MQVKADMSLIERQRECERVTTEKLDAYAAGLYPAASVGTCLTFHDLMPGERRDMTVILLQNLIDWEGFEFISEAGDNITTLALDLAGYISAPDAERFDLAHAALRRLEHNALLYAEKKINVSLSRVYESRRAA